MQATIHFNEDNGFRFWQQGGESEHNGEKITFHIDMGCGVNVAYKGKRYRIDPSEILAGVVDAIDGTQGGEEPDFMELDEPGFADDGNRG